MNRLSKVSMSYSQKVMSGFTLVELMVTIAILAIITSISAPSMSRTIANQRVNSAASVIESSLTTAVSESAIRRKRLRYTITINSGSPTVIEIRDPTITDYQKSLVNSYTIDTNIDIILSSGSPSSFDIGPGKRNRNLAGDDSVSVTFSICDKNASGEIKKEVSFNALAQVRQSTNGSCS